MLKHLHAGVSAGPLSLLLLPKCPLCFVPLFALFGLAIPASIGLWIVAAGLIAGWLVVLLLATRGQPLLRLVACLAAVVSFSAIALRNTLLLLPAVLAMTASGIASSRSCALPRRRREA